MTVYRSETDSAIIKALKGSREPLRYNELHRKASSVLGSRICIKTFNDHLKSLCKHSEVIRNEKNRYNVTYEPAREYRDEEREFVELEKRFLSVTLDFATTPPKIASLRSKKLRFQKRLIKSLTKSLTRRRWIELKILSATLALVTGKESEAQMMLDDCLFDYRVVLNHFVRSLSKMEGIKQIAEEMTKEWFQKTQKSMEKLKARMQELEAFQQKLKAGRKIGDPYLDVLNLADFFEAIF